MRVACDGLASLDRSSNTPSYFVLESCDGLASCQGKRGGAELKSDNRQRNEFSLYFIWRVLFHWQVELTIL